jgi:hypothetical protein
LRSGGALDRQDYFDYQSAVVGVSGGDGAFMHANSGFTDGQT